MGGQQPCSQYKVYPTKLHVCVHMAQYIWLREHTRAHCLSHTHTHSHAHIRHVNPWDSPFQGGVDDGRALTACGNYLLTPCAQCDAWVCLYSSPPLWQLCFRAGGLFGGSRIISIRGFPFPPSVTLVGQLCLLGPGQVGAAYGHRERERKEVVVNCTVMQLLLFTSCSELDVFVQ